MVAVNDNIDVIIVLQAVMWSFLNGTENFLLINRQVYSW